MKRKSILLSIALVLLLIGLGTVLVLLVRFEPGYYVKAGQAPSEGRKQRSAEFYNSTMGLVNDFLDQTFEQNGEDRSSWQWSFAADLINAYFSEDFVKSGLEDKLLPGSLREPRVSIEQDRIRLGFRYGKGIWTSIVTIDLRVWLVPREANVVALELQGMRLGALPISVQSLLERISESLRQSRVEISPWYRHKGNPVALLRLQSDRLPSSVRVTRLELRPGVVVIGGRTSNTLAARVPAPLPAGPNDGTAGKPTH